MRFVPHRILRGLKPVANAGSKCPRKEGTSKKDRDCNGFEKRTHICSNA